MGNGIWLRIKLLLARAGFEGRHLLLINGQAPQKADLSRAGERALTKVFRRSSVKSF